MRTGNFIFPSTSSGGGGGGDVVAGDTITPYVVSSDGTYTTIQDAVDAAEAAGGGLVWVRPGVYTEDVTVSLDDIFIVGASPGSVIISGSLAVDAGVDPGDAPEDHKVGIGDLTLRVSGIAPTALSVSGDPQAIYLDGVAVDAGTGSAKGVTFNVPGGEIHWRDTKCLGGAGNSGIPYDHVAGTAKFYSGCEVGLEDQDGVAIRLSAGSMDVYDRTVVKGTISNESAGNGTYAALIQEVQILTDDVVAFNAAGAGAVVVYEAVAIDRSGNSPDVGSGAGVFFWSALDVQLSGYANTDFPTCNAAAGALSVNGVGYASIRQVTTGGTDGQVLTADGAGSYDWEDIPEVDAMTITYTPTNAGDWDPDPTTAQEAFDDLADRVQVLYTGVNSGSYFFDGTDDYMEIANASAPNLTFAAADFTIEAWIHIGSTSGDDVIASKWEEITDASKNYAFRYDGTSRLELTLWDTSVGLQILQSGVERIEDSGWTHVAVAYDNTAEAATFYVNGRLSAVDTITLTGTTQGGTADFRLGSEDGNADFWQGHLNLVRIWSDVRTQSEINSNMYRIIGTAGNNLVSEWSLNGNANDPISGYDLTVSGAQSTAFVPWRN